MLIAKAGSYLIGQCFMLHKAMRPRFLNSFLIALLRCEMLLIDTCDLGGYQQVLRGKGRGADHNRIDYRLASLKKKRPNHRGTENTEKPEERNRYSLAWSLHSCIRYCVLCVLCASVVSFFSGCCFSQPLRHRVEVPLWLNSTKAQWLRNRRKGRPCLSFHKLGNPAVGENGCIGLVP